VSAFGFTEEVPTLMAAADVVVTSPGQTCHEARVVGRPVVVLDVVPGHGRENLLLELDHGGAIACTARPEAVVAAVEVAASGIEPPARPWPVSNVHGWRRCFLSAIDDLIGLEHAGAQVVAS
jgi:UDP-N-acetylglucosamine:LPS N-acetylglucosamine transferase